MIASQGKLRDCLNIGRVLSTQNGETPVKTTCLESKSDRPLGKQKFIQFDLQPSFSNSHPRRQFTQRNSSTEREREITVHPITRVIYNRHQPALFLGRWPSKRTAQRRSGMANHGLYSIWLTDVILCSPTDDSGIIIIIIIIIFHVWRSLAWASCHFFLVLLVRTWGHLETATWGAKDVVCFVVVHSSG